MVEQKEQATAFEPGDRDGSPKDGTAGYPPSTHASAAVGIGRTWWYSQTDQVLPFPVRFLPVVPNAIAQAIAQPFVHLLQFPINAGQFEIIGPAPHYRVDLGFPFVEAHRRRLAGQHLQFPFQTLPAFRRGDEPILPLPSFPVGRHKAMTQRLEVQGTSDTALFAVDRQPQLVAQKPENSVSHPPCCPLAAQVNAEIVGIPHIAVPAPFQLFIQFIQ